MGSQLEGRRVAILAADGVEKCAEGVHEEAAA